MKKISLYIAVVAFAATALVSCKPASTLQKDIKYLGIRFKPLSRADLTLVGNMETQITITGKVGKKGKMLDKSFAANMKAGKIGNQGSTTEVMYFAPTGNESITGSLYDNDLFNLVSGTGSINQKKGLFGGLLALFSGAKKDPYTNASATGTDPGLDFAYYALVEKYPDVDYFINVRFDRKSIVTGGGKFTETVIVKADGLKLKTD